MTDASRAIDDGWRELFALIDRAAEVHGDVVALRARMLAAAPSLDELERQLAAAGDFTTLPDAGDALATVAHHAAVAQHSSTILSLLAIGLEAGVAGAREHVARLRGRLVTGDAWLEQQEARLRAEQRP